MVQKDLKFNELKDIKEVEQFGFIDLTECLRNGEVPTIIDGDDVAYNGIEDPSEIPVKVAEVFYKNLK